MIHLDVMDLISRIREQEKQGLTITKDSCNEIRPSKVREMFASRACRKSVMIGQNLNLKEMERV